MSNEASSEHWASFTGLAGRAIHETLHRLEEDLDMQVWRHASTSHNGAGLDQGLPSYDPAAKAHTKLVKAGNYKMAKALELIVNNKTWSKQRLLDAGIISEVQAVCGRCGEATETDMHKYYQCKANDLIDCEAVTSTKQLGNDAKRQPHLACMWYRAIMPGSITSKPVGWAPIDTDEHYDTDFSRWLNDTGKVGTDGTCGIDNDPRARRVFAGVAVVSPYCQQVAYFHCKVFGRQTVPRAELTALYRTFRCIRAKRAWTIDIDAQYVINGLAADDRSFYLLGFNGDLRQLIYDKLAELEGNAIADINFIKVKSHVITVEEWIFYGMTADMYICNKLADETTRMGIERRQQYQHPQGRCNGEAQGTKDRTQACCHRSNHLDR